MQWDALVFLPHPTDITDITDIAPPPDHSPLFASIRWPGQAGLTSAGSVAAGSDGCLLGRIHFPCGYVVYVLLCCWGVFPVLTLYSPRSIVWGLFFSPHFPHVNAVFFFNSTCISLLIILVWLCMWRIIKNLEPWTLNLGVAIWLLGPWVFFVPILSSTRHKSYILLHRIKAIAHLSCTSIAQAMQDELGYMCELE